ncbi:helix-turn-helix transcriptional regulator (plasmid) [Streptomyces microflavus]|uniref:Scr1 family TA system antitoxin-like transcriptional regulator n=1 Tax=Streptomyces microflavus TaxID=1919 RepID=UPI002E1363A1|nr:helix-turn-helix transcriptional regulator [Streptomyces microflavus]
MTASSHTIAHVVGAVLSDARQHARITLDEAARRLNTPTEQLAHIESGHQRATREELHRSCRLYGVSDEAPALCRLQAGGGARAVHQHDREPGFAGRLAAVARQSVRVRWLSTHLLPPPLHTPAYAAAVHQPAPTRPWPPLRSQDVVVLDESVVRRGGATAALMCEQISHLLNVRHTGAQIHVVPDLFPPGSYVELTLAGAVTVLVTGGFDGTAYQATNVLATHIDRALDQPDPDRSHRLLTEAYAHHHTLREVW